MKQKSLLTLIFLVMFGIAVKAQTDLILKFTNSAENKTALSSVNKITFSQGNLLLSHGSGITDSFSLLSVDKLYFSPTILGVDNVFATENSLAAYPNPATNSICLKNAPEDTLSVAIYRLDGRVLISVQLLSSTQSIDVSQFPSGIYVLKVNNQTLKFAKL